MYTNTSWHIWINHGIYEWVIKHMWKHPNSSLVCTYACVLYMNVYIYSRLLLDVCKCVNIFTRMNGSCDTHESATTAVVCVHMYDVLQCVAVFATAWWSLGEESTCMCVCVCVRVCVYLWICPCVCVHVCMCACECVCVCVLQCMMRAPTAVSCIHLYGVCIIHIYNVCVSYICVLCV